MRAVILDSRRTRTSRSTIQTSRTKCGSRVLFVSNRSSESRAWTGFAAVSAASANSLPVPNRVPKRRPDCII